MNEYTHTKISLECYFIRIKTALFVASQYIDSYGFQHLLFKSGKWKSKFPAT